MESKVREADMMTVVRYSVEDGVGWITMNRPEVLNASNMAMKHALLEAFAHAAADVAVQAIVLTGAGRAFCVGGDLKEPAEPSPQRYRERIATQQSLCLAISSSDKLVLAAINGYALGGGLEMALMCDTRIAARSARLGSPAIRIGSIATGGLHLQLARVIGQGRAQQMILTADPVDAQTAERIGLVTEVVDDELLHATSQRHAIRIAGYPAASIAASKRAIRAGTNAGLADLMELESELAVSLAGSRNAQ